MGPAAAIEAAVDVSIVIVEEDISLYLKKFRPLKFFMVSYFNGRFGCLEVIFGPKTPI